MGDAAENIERPDFGTRQAPRNIEAEMGLLGAVFLDNACLDDIEGAVSPEHFFLPAHQRIFAACLTLRRQGQVADPTTLRPMFERDGDAEEIGGAAYLANLTGHGIGRRAAPQYARIIRDTALKRHLIDIADRLSAETYEADLDTSAARLIEGAEKLLFDLSAGIDEGRGPKHVAEFVREFIEESEAARRGERVGVQTGFADLDAILGGMHAGDLVILGGRPAMGKTALAANIGFQCRVPALLNELEMSGVQLAGREASARCSFSSFKARTGKLDDNDMSRLASAAEAMAAAPVWVDDTPGVTVQRIRSGARRWARKHGGKLLIVDYLQLIETTSGGHGRTQEVTEISRGLKLVAKELQIPVLVLSQLSRNLEQRDDKRPRLPDLRESGAIEQDADSVLFVFREEEYLKQSAPDEPNEHSDKRAKEKYAKWQADMDRCQNIAEVIVAKNRHGPLGTAKLRFDPETTKFHNLSRWG